MASKSFFATLEKKFKVTKTQSILFAVLVVWAVAVFFLLKSAFVNNPYSIIAWTSLNTIFTGFSSLALIIVAILLINKAQ